MCFDHLDTANREIASALVDRNASDARGFQMQISALSTLLDRAEIVVTSQEDASRRIIVDIFHEVALASNNERNRHVVEAIRESDQALQREIPKKILEGLRFEYIAERLEIVEESHAKTFEWILAPIEDTVQYTEGRRWSDFRSWLEVGAGIYCKCFLFSSSQHISVHFANVYRLIYQQLTDFVLA